MKPSDSRLMKSSEIKEALEQGAHVYADCMNLPERLPVKDAKMSGGILRVQLLEGWRVPFCVYISPLAKKHSDL